MMRHRGSEPKYEVLASRKVCYFRFDRGVEPRPALGTDTVAEPLLPFPTTVFALGVFEVTGERRPVSSSSSSVRRCGCSRWPRCRTRATPTSGIGQTISAHPADIARCSATASDRKVNSPAVTPKASGLFILVALRSSFAVLDRCRASFSEPERHFATGVRTYSLVHSNRALEAGFTAFGASKAITKELELGPPSLLVT